MRVRSVVPVQETFHIDDITDVKIFDCLVDVRIRSAEIGLYREGICLAVYGDVEIQIVAFLFRSRPSCK